MTVRRLLWSTFRKDASREGNAVGLIFLEGGPLDGNAYDTKDLLGVSESALPRGYVWTSERRTSPRTGKTAQVWRYAGDGLPPQQSPSAQTADTVPDDTELTAEQLGELLERGVPVTMLHEARASVALDRDQTHVVGEPATPTERVEQTAAAGPQIRDRRKAVKVSAGKLAELAGLKQSRVYAIETDSGKPVTPAERSALEEALTRLEAEASAH
jgi:hypothetical protein